MNMNKMFFAVAAMFGYGQKPLPSEKGKFENRRFEKKDKSKPKLGSINEHMKMYRNHAHGTMSRMIARNKVKGRFIFA